MFQGMPAGGETHSKAGQAEVLYRSTVDTGLETAYEPCGKISMPQAGSSLGMAMCELTPHTAN